MLRFILVFLLFSLLPAQSLKPVKLSGYKNLQPGLNGYVHIPFRTVNISPQTFLPGSVLFIPALQGLPQADGSLHDGYVVAAGIHQGEPDRVDICGDLSHWLKKPRAEAGEVYGTMAKIFRLRFEDQYRPQRPKYTWEMVASDFDTLLVKSKVQKMSRAERLQFFSTRAKGTPYLIYSMGEGAGTGPDRDPLIDFARTDCMLFCEHMLAMSISDSYESLFNNLQKIRYKDGVIDYTNRNHYTIADWLPNNQWLLEDVTQKVAPGKTESLTKTIDHRQFFLNNGVEPGRADQGAGPQQYSIDYVPTSQLMAIAPNLQGGEIVSIITSYPGVLSAHMGLIIRDAWGNLIFRHASSSRETREVMDVPFAQYVEILKESKSRVGMVFMRVREF